MAAYWSWQAGRLKSASVAEELRDRVVRLEEWAETGSRPRDLGDPSTDVLGNPDARAAAHETVVLAWRQWADDKEASSVACGLVQEVFGNPFRSIDFDSVLRTDTAVAIAVQMYEARDFSAMPILADALQDAGCDNGDVLNHCRQLGEHVRGCWVVDLVLGRE